MAKDLARQLAEEMKRKKEEQERLDAAKTQHPHLPVASLPNDTAQYSTAIDTSVVGDNRQTLKMRNFMNPYNQAERGFTGMIGANFFGANPNIPSLKYGFTGNTDATDLMASYAEIGGMAKKLFDYGRTGKTGYQLQSYMDALASGDMAARLGINDPGVAYALSADAMNKANSAIAAGQKTKPHDLVSTYVDENAGKGYSVTNQAGDLHDFRGDVLKNAEIKKKNVQEGLYNNDELLQAGEYDLLSPDYMDMIIKDYPAKIEELGPMIDAAKSERTPYEQHWNKPWFRDLHECQTLGIPLEPEDMYQFAATMYPGETYVRADFEEYGDPEAIARVSQDVASMVAMHGNGGWEEARSNKVKQLEAQRDSLQMVLDDTKAARGRQQEIAGFGQKYAGGDTAFHPESFLEHGAAFDISDRLLYINLMGNPDGTWQKDAAAQMGREHLGTNNYDLEALNFLTPEEVGYINAEWNANHDADEVERMIDLYAPILYARQREALESREAYAADMYGLGYDIYNNTINTLGTSAEGLRNFFVSSADSLGFDVKGIDDPNSPYYNASNKSEFGHQWRATQAETSLPGFGEKLYGIPTGALREGTKLGVSSLLGGAMGGLGFVDDAAKAAARAYEAASGVEALGSGLKEGYERGYGKFAPLYAAGSAAMSAGTEHIGVDNLFKGSGKWWKTMGATGASETVEELANMAGEGMLESAFDAVSGRKFSDNDRLFLQTYMDTGSVEEAEAAVAKANREEAATTAVTSFGIGALLGAPAAYQESSAMRKRGKSVSSNSNTGALMDVAMSLDEGSDARQLAETLKAQADKGKKPSNGQLGRLYATIAKNLDAKSAAVVTETMQDAIVDEMVDKGENEEVARRAAPILAKQLRGEKLTNSDTSALAESKTAITMMEELNKYTEGGKEDGPKTGLFKRTRENTAQATDEQIQTAEEMLLERGDSAKAAKRAAPLLARVANGDTLTKSEQAFVDQTEGSEEIVSKLRSEKTGNKPLQRPAWVEDVETRQAVYAAPKAEEIATKGKALLDTTRPSNQTAIAKSADKAKALTVKDGAAKDGVRDTTAVPLGSKESVDIQRIEADNDGVLKLVTKDSTGKESKTSYKTLSFKGGSVGHVITHAVDNYAGNAEMANLMYQSYTGGDSTKYIAKMDAAYRAGFDASAVNRDSMTQYKGVAKHAFELGQKQAQEAEQTRMKNIGKAKLGKGRVTIPTSVNETKLSKQQRNQVAIVRRIADATGINFTFYESQADATGMYKADNGSYDSSTNSIRLDLNAGKNFKGDIAEYAIVRTAAHEMTHFIEANSRENYAKMRQFIADELARKGLNFNSLVQAKIDRSHVPLTRGGAIAEVVADGCEMMLKDSEAIQRLMQKDASLGEQIKKVLKEFVGRIRKAFESIRPGSIEAKALMDEVDGVLKYADELQKLWDVGLEEAVEATRGDGLAENGVIVESKTAYANPQLSVRTWNASGYVQERDTMAKELAAKTGVTVSKATKWLDDVNSIASMVLSDPLRLDYISSEFGSSFKSNPEYGGSVDMSTLCPKRRLATGTLDAIQDRLGDVALTRDDFLRLRAMMAERGHEVACGLCFVESSRANLSKYNKQFIDLYNATHTDQEPVTMGELNTIDGLESIRSERPDVYAEYEKFMNKLAQRKPKLFEKRTEYDGEILKKFRKDTSVDAKNRNGGLRLQSFSDFELVHLIDMMQVITDMANVGLAGQAYTKVPDFAWALGNTGLKINLSLIAKGVDENGKLIFNDIEGMNHVEAKKLRDAYSKNVGTILVIFTDEQLIAAMQDDFVDFIIPFHRSQWKKTDYRILGLPEGTKNYTLHQNEKMGRKRVKKNFMPNEYWDFTISGKENARKYLDMCNAEGRTPKFAKFLQKNANGTYSLKDDGSTDGYWKLLIDFKMYDNDGNGSEQLPVQPNFNMKQAVRMLNEYKGGHETLPVAWDVVDDFVAEYQGKKGNVQYSPRVGYTREGLAVYASNFADGTTMPERQARILSLVQNVWAEKPIELEIVRNGKRETIIAHFDPYVDPAGRTNSDATKLAYGNRKGTASDRKTTSKLANDFPEIIASSSYDHSSEETGKTTFTHDGVLVWHYFANRIGFIHEDGRYAEYDVSIDVKEREDGAFVYAFAAVKRKGSERSEAPSLVGDPGTMNAPVRGIAPAIATTSIPENGENGNGFSQKSLRTSAPATTRDYLLSLTDADLSTAGEKDAMMRYRVMVDELRELEEKRAAQQEIAATATGDDRIKAKNRADIYTVQIDRLNDRIRGKENTNVLRPIVAEAKAILEANRQLEIGRPVETVIKGMGGKVRDAETKLNRFREKVKQERDAREKITASRRRITKMVKYLDTLRRKESDYKHVPEELKPTVNALVAAFAEHSSMVFDSKRAERIAQAYSKLQALDNDLAAYYDPDVQARIEYIADLMELKRGKPMTLAEMEIIEDVVGAIYKMVRGSNEAFFEGRSMDIAQIASDVADEMLQRKDRLYRMNSKAEEALDTLIRNGNLTPVYYFDNLNNAMLKRLGYDILGGQDKYGLYQRDDRVTMSDIRKKYNYNSWRNDKPIVHNDVQFTKEQALWVYATAKREATNELAQTHHLDEGGIVFEGGEVVGADGKKRKRTTPMRLSAKDVQAITSTLTEEQKGYADAVVQHLSTTVGERGNEVSMRMYGFRKYREQYYFPYKTASDQRHQTSVSNAVSATNDARLKHQSFSNPLKKGANTPLVIGDFTAMATSHMNAMNTYAAMVIPVENMNRVLNRKTEIDGAVTTLRGLMAQKYGDSTKRYLETLLKDLNGGAQVDNRTGGLIDKTVGMYKKGAVVGSAPVVLQQWTSIFRAAYMINPKYLAGATFSKRDWAELTKYSGVATIKDMGRFDVNVGVGGSNWLAADADDFNTWEKAKQMLNPRDWETFKTRWDDAVNFLPGWADRVTWAQIWNAVKAEQADQHPGMDKTSDAFLKMCAERFNDIINHTQVYDSTMTRSQLMRSKGALDKMATAFGSEPTMILNMVYDAIHNPAYKGKRKGKIGACIATVTLSQLAAAAMQALGSAWRKDDDERKALEKFLDKWSYNFFDNMNPFTMFPYMRDVWDTFATSYDVERSDMALFSELKDALTKLNNDNYSPYRKVEELAGTLAKFGGIPLKNIMRDLRSAYNAILKTDWSVPEASSIGYTLLDNLPFRDSSKTAYYQRMENAYASGDEERADDIAQYLESNDTTADAVGAKLSGMLKRMLAAGNDAAVDAILADMAARGRERDGGDLRTIINDLYKNGEIDWQQAERLYKKHTNLTSANDLYWHKQDLDYKGEGNYSAYRAAREALLAGDKKTYLAEKSKLLTHGKQGPNVMKETVTNLKDELLALYETDITAARKLREMIVWAYMECGKTKDSANKIIDGWFKD